MDSSEITIIMGVKNRPIEMVWRTIRSIEKQTATCKTIIVSYGSSEESYTWEKRLIPSKNVKLIRVTKGTEYFDVARAKNIGIKKAKTKYIMISDIDIILKEDFIEVAIKEAKRGKHIVLCRRLEKRSADTGAVDYGDWACTGSCIIIDRKWLVKVHGMDENYKDLGISDGDLVNRAVEDGYKKRWIHDDTAIIHQHHRKSEKLMLGSNREYNAIKGKPIIRNFKGWGII